VYDGPVIHLKDASQNALVATKLMNPEFKQEYVQNICHEQAELREKKEEKQVKLVSLEEATANKLRLF
jgi:5-methyltetrahydrofolate--homocysteine methyltransferase